ncbi:MAG: DUF3592 domain-containing protein [Anaerolineae bacterium]|nr:DUF3592 domain-containing protein [Anaerolineae bacterium]
MLSLLELTVRLPALLWDRASAVARPSRATGVIVAASVCPTRPDAGDHAFSQLYQPVVKFRYVVNHEGYVSTRLYDNPLSNSIATFDRRRAEAVVRRFQPGSMVTVHYDPRHPERAYLLRGLSREAIVALASAGLLTVLTIVAIYMGLSPAF